MAVNVMNTCHQEALDVRWQVGSIWNKTDPLDEAPHMLTRLGWGTRLYLIKFCICLGSISLPSDVCSEVCLLSLTKSFLQLLKAAQPIYT